ncbi:MAG: Alcohol dehydrogenase, zinc-binding domain protein [Alphaproteobacteria bacterium]|jgi:NADPH2:quinone reductase|nr:Alcohol dehydrogenase, zinc-binding domain protein [Alphaproteobacteria bacterium]
MQALLCSRLGDPSVLELVELEPPAPKPGEIGVQVRAASINFPDVLMVAGGYQLKPPLPFIPGMEACGEVVALGDGVRDHRIGDRVIFGKRFGAFAEQVTVPAAEARPLPKGWSFAEGAAFAVGYKTAYHAIVQRGHIRPREVLLVHGASGGVGLAAVELGKVLGARVIATGSDDARLDVVREKGADFVLNYREAPFWQAVKDLTDGKGADVIYDPVGGDVFDQSLKCIAWNGRILLIGFTSGRIATLPTNIALIKGFSVIGVRAGEAVRREPQIGVEYHRELWQLANAGRIRPHVSHVLPLDRWVEAMALLTERKVVGKAVLDLGGATQT